MKMVLVFLATASDAAEAIIFVITANSGTTVV